MSTVEKLFVQIFERKDSIIEQVRQQTELYSQHLASKLLIDGITPPSWLWDPNASSNSKEPDREELISKLLRPHPQSSARCSFASYPFYNNLVTTGDNEAFSEKRFMENFAFSNHRQDDPAVPEFEADDHAAFAINSVPEQDNSVTSPENQTEERILDIYSAAEQSLSRIQRSRSRQKALELRNSAKSQAKSCSRHENKSNLLSKQIEPGAQKDDVAKSAETCVGNESCEMFHGDGVNLFGKENDMDLDSDRNTWPRIHSQGQIFVRDSLTSGCSSKDCGKRECVDGTKDKTIDNFTDIVSKSNISGNHQSSTFDSSRAGSSLDDYQSPNAARKYPRVDDLPPDNVDGSLVRMSSDVHCEDCGAREPVSEGQESQKGRPTSPSLSSSQRNCVQDIPDVKISCNSAKADVGIPSPSSKRSSLVENSNELQVSATLSGCFHKVTRLHACSNPQEPVSGDLESRRASLRYGKLNCRKDVSDLEIPCSSAKDDGDIPVPSSRYNTKELRRSDKPHVGFRRVTRSQAHSNAQDKPKAADYNGSPSLVGTITKSEYKQKSKNVELQNVNRGLPLLGTLDLLGDHEIDHNFIPSTAKERRQLEPQPNFVENEGHILKASASSSQNRRFASSTEKKSGSLSDPDVFADEGVSGDANQLFMNNQSVSKSNCKQTSANVELQNVKQGPPLHEAHDMMVVENETAHNLILSSAKEIRQLESHIVSTPSISLEYVAPMQPSFIENEERDLKPSASSSQNRRSTNPSEKVSCSLSDPAIYVDKGVCGDVNHLSVNKESASKSNCEQKSTNVEIPIVNGGLPPFTHHMLGEHELSRDFIPTNGKERIQVESHILSVDSGSFESLKPMQTNFVKTEVCNWRGMAPSSQKRRFTNSPEKIICSLSDPAICVDERVFGDVNQLSMHKQSQKMLDVSANVEEARCDSFQSDAHEDPCIQADRLRCVDISDYIPNLQIHPAKLQLKYGVEALQEQHPNEECGEGMDEDQSMPNSSGSEKLGPSPLQYSGKEPRVDSHDNTIGVVQKEFSICVLEKMENSSAQDSQNYVCLEGQNAGCSTVLSPPPANSLWRKCAHVSMESWPKLKRRKTDPRQTQSSTGPPIPRVGMPQGGSLRSPTRKYKEYMNTSIDTILIDASNVNKTVDAEALQKMGSNLSEGIESHFSFNKAEVTLCHKEKNLSSVIKANQLEAAHVPSVTIKEARNSQGFFVEKTNFRPLSSNYVGDARDRQCSHLEENHNDSSFEDLTHANTMLDEMRSPKWEGGSQAQPRVLFRSADDLNLVDVDQSLPVFEGFTVDAEVDSGELEFEANGVNFDKMELPRNTIERASILAEICKSASLNTDLPHFSSTLEHQGTENLFQSCLDDHYEHSNIWSALPLNLEVEHQLASGSMLEEDCKHALEVIPHYDFQANSGSQYDWTSRNHYGSPIGKPWGKLSSNSGSSGKSLGSNPELVCFPIEEDPTSSEENNSADEHAEDDLQEQVDQSSTEHCDRRPPYRDLTNLDTSIPANLMPRADSLDFMSKKLSLTGATDKVHQDTQYQNRDESQALEKEVKTLSVATNKIRKTKVSINNSISKPTQSNKTSLKRQEQKLSLRGSGRNNNIVSTVTSFIPMVQAKKDAAVCAGKRDVKVKSIAAAEAAKRLEEKKENERRMKKEALKQERAMLEEKNLRNMELDKKKKEEERKKRDADNMARKRLREEEAKKEKVKKRVKLETRQHQREQNEKIHAEKVGKGKQKSKDEQMNSKRELHNESKKQHNRETSNINETALKKTENKCNSTDVVMNSEECGTSGQSCEVEKTMHIVDKSPRKEDSILQNSQGKSYEISPYQCSDDDDDEEEELPLKKSIPSWASKHYVALLLPLQQDMDPDVAFPPHSFCNIDEVLLPRKLQQKLVAT